MQAKKITDYFTWFEVWYDWSAIPPYVLILLHYESDSSFHIYDPAEKRTCEILKTYEDACFWLAEDEYTKVTGRMTDDD